MVVGGARERDRERRAVSMVNRERKNTGRERQTCTRVFQTGLPQSLMDNGYDDPLTFTLKYVYYVRRNWFE